MKTTAKDLLISTIISIGAAMATFCIVGIVFDVINGGSFHFENYRFTKMVIGCVVTGLGFGLPSGIYRNESLPMPLRMIIHLGVGCAVYTITAFAVGWIGGMSSVGQGILIACIQFAVVLFIWLLFFRHNKREAKRMNDRLSEMNQ